MKTRVFGQRISKSLIGLQRAPASWRQVIQELGLNSEESASQRLVHITSAFPDSAQFSPHAPTLPLHHHDKTSHTSRQDEVCCRGAPYRLPSPAEPSVYPGQSALGCTAWIILATGVLLPLNPELIDYMNKMQGQEATPAPSTPPHSAMLLLETLTETSK